MVGLRSSLAQRIGSGTLDGGLGCSKPLVKRWMADDGNCWRSERSDASASVPSQVKVYKSSLHRINQSALNQIGTSNSNDDFWMRL
jgi:hypothetical protein